MSEQLVHGIADPAIAISQSGRVVSANAAAERLFTPGGAEATGPLGRYCGDVVRAHDATGRMSCTGPPCPVLDTLAAGDAVELGWCGREVGADVAPLDGSVIAIPPAVRRDDAIAVIVLRATEGRARSAALHPSMDGADADATRGGAVPHFQFLGRPAAHRDGEPVLPRRRRVLELVALLASEERSALHRDQICAALWPDVPADRARTHLRVLTHEARQCLGPDVLVSAPDATLVLHPEAVIDARDFQRAATLLLQESTAPGRGGPCLTRPGQLRAGPRSPGAAAPTAEQFTAIDRLVARYRGDYGETACWGDWVMPVAAQLRATFLSTLAYAVALTAHADPERTIRYCKRALEREPLMEEFQAALIIACGESGHQVRALTQYAAYRELAAEFGVRPSAAFEEAVRPFVTGGMRAGRGAPAPRVPGPTQVEASA